MSAVNCTSLAELKNIHLLEEDAAIESSEFRD